MEKEGKGMMIYSATGCSETSVRRQERDYEATNLSRDEHSVSVPGREGRVVDEGAPKEI